jgi:hypothetical protein
MKIHIENWTLKMFLDQLDAKGHTHGDYLLKAYATYEDPTQYTTKPDLAVFDSPHTPFTEDEVYKYPRRGNYTGPQLEADLKALKLSPTAEDTLRALFRFANRPDTRFCQNAMDAEQEGSEGQKKWFIQHPFQDLDGVAEAGAHQSRESLIHLDIFYPPSLDSLKKLVDYTDETTVVDYRESRALRMKMSREGAVSGSPEL